jgi:tetratricopeptide (TPR) repeat protein
VAEILRDRFAAMAAAEPEALAHHFTQAGMTDAAIEWWGKAGDQALRRSAFQEAISHLGKAIEMADKGGESSTPRAAGGTGSGNQRLKLQTSYGQALLWSKGYVAEETTAAFARAKELAAGISDVADRFPTYYGLWVGSLLRGELGLAWQTAETMLRETHNEARTPEAAVARRVSGLTCLLQGNFTDARAHIEEALRVCDPGWDRDVKFRFGQDIGAAATGFLAHATWVLGEVGRARALIEEAAARAVETGHVPTLANAYTYKIVFEALGGEASAERYRRGARACG